MKDYSFFSLSLLQTVFLIIGLVGVLVFTFYMGARFGPEFLWDRSISNLESTELLPAQITDEDIHQLQQKFAKENFQFYRLLEDEEPLKARIKFEPVKNELVVKYHQREADKKEFIKNNPIITEVTQQKNQEIETQNQASNNLESTSIENKTVTNQNTNRNQPVLDTSRTNQNANESQGNHQANRADSVSDSDSESESDSESDSEQNDPLADLLKKDLNTKYTLILGQYNQYNQAKNQEKYFKEDGYSVWIEESISAQDKIIYELRVGRYSSRKAAEIGKNRFKKLYRITPSITEL